MAFQLYDRNGSRVFYSGTSQSRTETTTKYEAGSYVAEVTMPPKFLAPGTYTITAILHQPNVAFFDKQDGVIGFSIIESGSAHYKYANQDVGSILVDFDWTVAPAEDEKE